MQAQICAIPRTGQNLCNQEQTSYVENTANSVTINEIALVPAAGTYNVTISYYKQSTSSCQPVINITGATVTTSGAGITISWSGGVNLPASFSSEAIIYTNLTDGPEGNYFLHIYGGACILPLGYAAHKKGDDSPY